LSLQDFMTDSEILLRIISTFKSEAVGCAPPR